MKLRLEGNSIRVRLDRCDIERLFDVGHVDDAVRFGPGLAFSYAVQAGPAPRERPRVSYTVGRLTIQIDPVDVEEWLSGDRVGFDHLQDVEGASCACSWRRTLPASTGHSGMRRMTPTPSPTHRPFANASRSARVQPSWLS
jgi:hypothetical protein